MTVVKRLPRDPGPAAWNDILPDQTSAVRLEDHVTADWLVIGAGFAGLTAARRLRELHPHDRIVVLDAKRIADGPAGRNSGFMIDLPHDLASDDYGGGVAADKATTAANRAAISYAQTMATEFQMPQWVFNPSGKWNAAATDKGHQHNLDYARHLAAMGEGFDLFDAARMRDLTGTDYYQSGLFTPGTVMLQPAGYIRTLADGLGDLDVQIYEHSPVLRLDRKMMWTAKTPLGSVQTPKVILAVNGHANSFGHFAGALMHVFTYASMTRALTGAEVATLGGVPEWGATPADPLGTTVRRVSGPNGDRIIIRNRATFDPKMMVSDARIAAAGRTHDRSFTARFPMLKDVDMEYRWGGRLCLSRNNVAAFGQVDRDLYAACCQNGLGAAKGTLHGMLAADLASDVPSPLLDQVLAEDAPKPLPPRPMAWLGANALMRWGEFKAGREL
ncbi:MAG: FAD-binding oxidoreductase [Pseudomonadota bacterium]